MPDEKAVCITSSDKPVSKTQHKLKTRTSEPMPPSICTLQTRLIHDLKRNRQTNNRRTENNSKTITDQSLQRSRFDDQSHHDTTDQSKPRPEAHHLKKTPLHFTLKMTNTQVVDETSVTNNSFSKDYPHPDDHAKQTTDSPGFKLFTT